MTRAEALKEIIRSLTVTELRRRSAQKSIEGEYRSMGTISSAMAARRDDLEKQVETLKAKLFDSVAGLTPNELSTMADEFEVLR